MNRIELSNRQLTRAANNGGTVEIPWPVEYLGEYGSHMFDGSPTTPAGEDAAMDRYVREHVAQDVFSITGAVAGRKKDGTPVIALRVAFRVEFR